MSLSSFSCIRIIGVRRRVNAWISKVVIDGGSGGTSGLLNIHSLKFTRIFIDYGFKCIIVEVSVVDIPRRFVRIDRSLYANIVGDAIWNDVRDMMSE